jgi:phosphatidylinositol 4-kinase type 2
MFARQMAVMKGQAWNVVETLKTADHGPLELTRRAKVCVWDDLVDVPVAIPMRVTSAEMRRATAAMAASAIGDAADYFGVGPWETIEEEEMDIGVGTASSSAPVGGGGVVVDLLGLSSPSMGGPAELPHPGRFELTPTPSPGPRQQQQQQPDEEAVVLRNGERERPSAPRHSLSQPALPHQQRSLNMYSPERERGGAGAATSAAAAAARWEHQRRFSFATAAGRRNSNTIAHQLYRQSSEVEEDDDGLEGDLGYAAAEGMEGNQRKVIVERLEPVKTRNPVFTWC